MTNKEFYGDKLLAIALKDNCHELQIAVYDESCVGKKKCENCEFNTIKDIENWLNAEYVKPEPSLLKNGDGLKPGDQIMVRNSKNDNWGKRQFAYYFDGAFYCAPHRTNLSSGLIVKWDQARLPMEGE